MIDLQRTVRFCINPRPVDERVGPGRGAAAMSDAETPRSNTYSAWPAMRGLGRYYELSVTCRGEPDRVSGYFMNIKAIDKAVRECVIPLIAHAVRDAESTTCPTRLIREFWPSLNEALGHSVREICWHLTPFYHVCLATSDTGTESAPVTDEPRVLVRQHFEFAASHRLHSPEFSAEENRAYFGKCNNENGHGHNYRVEVAVAVLPDHGGAVSGEPESAKPRDGRRTRRPFDVGRLDRIVDEHVIERFDHKHLNLDCPEFESLNPSVENIARICYELLEAPLREHEMPLREVTVWETEKTRCTYPA